MKAEDAVAILRALGAECAALPAETSSAEFTAWYTKTRSVLIKALGENHHITDRFGEVSWSPWVAPTTRDQEIRSFQQGQQESTGLINAAIFELETLAGATDIVSDAGFDPAPCFGSIPASATA